MNAQFKRQSMLCALLFFTALSYAQTHPTLILADKKTRVPIPNATFAYGDQQGVSDADGKIYFAPNSESTLIISHLNYGQVTFDNAMVQNIEEGGILYLSEIQINLQPVTVLALRPQSSPETSLKLDYQEYLAHDAAAILMQDPAIGGIRKGGNYGFDPVFRGFKYDQINVVLNGAQGATAACPNRMDPPTSQMAPNMIDRIEILKGPHALRYGVGLGATMNFVPAQLQFSETPDVYGRLSNSFEGNGSVFRNEGQLGFSGNLYDASFFGSWSQGGDYTSGAGQTIQADFKRGSFGTQLGFKISTSDQIRLSIIYNLARDADFPALAMDLREDDTWLVNARYDKEVKREHLKSWNTTVYGSFVNHLMDNLLKPLDPRMLNASTDATTFNYGLRSETVWSFSQNKFYAGLDFRNEGAEGTRTREFLMGPNQGTVFTDNVWQDGNILKGSVFAEYRIQQARWNYVFSTRLELNTGQINDPAPEFQDIYEDSSVTQFNPSISIGAKRLLDSGMSLGVWFGRAARSGGLAERYINYFPIGQDPYEMLGNPLLDPEVNYQLDLTYNLQLSNMTLGADIFAGYLTDFISSVIDPDLQPRLPMSPGVRRYINIDEAFKAGAEVYWTQNIFQTLQHQLGIAYTYAQDLERGEPLPEIAPLDLRYSLSGNFIGGKLRPEVTFRHVLRQARISEEFGETETPSFSLLNASLTYQLTGITRMNLGVNNLFDENYYEHLNRSVRGGASPIFEPGRNFFASVNFVF